MLVTLRSILFNVLFYLNLVVQLIAALPTLVLPRRAIIEVARFWARTNIWLLRLTCGTKVEFRGLSKIPAGPLLVASKHQSLWETFALLLLLPDPAYIMKRELMWIPFFGWYTWKAGMIPVDRGKGSQALAGMNARARAELARDRQIIIFPGRHAPPARCRAPLQVRDHAPLCRDRRALPADRAQFRACIWPRRSMRRNPGTIRVEILDPIPPGLDKETFFARLQQSIEPATARLVAEGERELAKNGVDRASLAPSA